MHVYIMYSYVHILFFKSIVYIIDLIDIINLIADIIVIFLDSTKFKIVWIKITTFFKRRVSIIL